MYENIPRNKQLLVISDTGIYKNNEKIIAFGPVVKELTELLSVFDEIIWIGFQREDQKNNNSYIQINDKRIKIITLNRVGGKNIIDKIKILLAYPVMFFIIRKQVIKHQFIHTRAPSNPALIAVILSFFYTKKIFWHKYAGSWIDKASSFYEFQRKILKKTKKNSFVTINGNYDTHLKNIIPFENPCLTKKDRKEGENIIKNKKVETTVNFCFVGGLNKHKGVDKILKAFQTIQNDKIGTIHFVGDGKDRVEFEELAKKVSYPVIFHGYLPKEEIIKVYSKSHYLLLPSKSEGFPKVVGEGMNFGCVPIVSNVSCIADYVKDEKNGYLISPVTTTALIKKINTVLLNHNKIEFMTKMDNNYCLAAKFTYSFYNKRIKEEIFKIN